VISGEGAALGDGTLREEAITKGDGVTADGAEPGDVEEVGFIAFEGFHKFGECACFWRRYR
jgi:hypothetical protein